MMLFLILTSNSGFAGTLKLGQDFKLRNWIDKTTVTFGSGKCQHIAGYLVNLEVVL